MNPSTAAAKLRKDILFNYAKKCGDDICHQCRKKIESVDNFSIEHKIPWLHSKNPVELFFNLENIAFSHLHCNVLAARSNKGKFRGHPSQGAYKRGCRCNGCKKIQKNRMKIYRLTKKTINV